MAKVAQILGQNEDGTILVLGDDGKVYNMPANQTNAGTGQAGVNVGGLISAGKGIYDIASGLGFLGESTGAVTQAVQAAQAATAAGQAGAISSMLPSLSTIGPVAAMVAMPFVTKAIAHQIWKDSPNRIYNPAEVSAAAKAEGSFLNKQIPGVAGLTDEQQKAIFDKMYADKLLAARGPTSKEGAYKGDDPATSWFAKIPSGVGYKGNLASLMSGMGPGDKRYGSPAGGKGIMDITEADLVTVQDWKDYKNKIKPLQDMLSGMGLGSGTKPAQDLAKQTAQGKITPSQINTGPKPVDRPVPGINPASIDTSPDVVDPSILLANEQAKAAKKSAAASMAQQYMQNMIAPKFSFGR